MYAQTGLALAARHSVVSKSYALVHIDMSPISSTPDRGQSKMLLTIVERGSQLTRNRVFNSHLWLVSRLMAIENSCF